MSTQIDWNVEKKLSPIFWIFAFAIVFAVVYHMAISICAFPGTIAIIVVNICITILIWINKISMEELASSYKAVFIDKQFYRVLTAAFTHVLPIHILMNLISLYNIGSVLEVYLTSNIFLIVYFLVLIIGGFISALIHRAHLHGTPCIGASGALCGLLGIYIAKQMVRPTKSRESARASLKTASRQQKLI